MNVVSMINKNGDAQPIDLFSYAMLAREDEAEVREAAERIKLRLRRSAEDIIEIGKDLIAVKDRLPHGSFLPWIEQEFGMSRFTANRFMAVAEVYGAKGSTVQHLDLTALYELAAPKTPIEVREEVEKMIEAGEVVTKATVVELRNKLSGLEKAKALAEQEIEKKTAAVEAIEGKIDEAIAEQIKVAADKIAKQEPSERARIVAGGAMFELPMKSSRIRQLRF